MPTQPQFPVATAQAKLRDIEDQLAVLLENVAQLKVMLSTPPKPRDPPHNEEQGVGRPNPKVVMSPRHRR